MNTPHVAFIGLGVMGRPMAQNLLRAGLELTVHSRRREPGEALVAEGARPAASPAEAAAAADVVITMLPDTTDVQAVLDGPQGVFTSARAGTVIADMSTISPSGARELANAGRARGLDVLDAPVSGGETAARDGTLTIMVGGEAAALARARPVLEHLGSSIVHIGEAGAGQVAKACNQLVVGSTIEAVAEALDLARRSSVDPAAVHMALRGGFAGSRVLEVHGRRMLERDFRPGFRAALHLKDARIVRETAHEHGAAIPGFLVTEGQFEALVASGHGDLDHAALLLALPGA
jgi:2-hydroxy-3-oxopropionate reductase